MCVLRPFLVIGLFLSTLAKADPIADFVCQNYENGAVPFRAAHNLGTPAIHVRILINLLNDNDHAHSRCRYQAAMTLGAIGTNEAVKALIEFISRGKGTLTDPEFAAKRGAILALGWAANIGPGGAGNTEALDRLIVVTDGSEAEPWNTIQWKPPISLQLSTYLSGQALQALGLSGSDQARMALEKSPLCGQRALKDDCDDAKKLLDRAKNGLDKIYP